MEERGLEAGVGRISWRTACDPARAITATYTYDAVHRKTGVSYSNGDPSLTFTYDEANCLGLTACQNIGHRTSMTDGAGSEKWAYQIDKPNLRSIHKEQRTNNSTPSNVTKTTTYYLDLAGNVTQIVYPTGRTVNYTYNAADRPITAADASNGITYATDWKTPGSGCQANAVCYTPQGRVYNMSLGQTTSFTGFNLSETFNNRLQPNEIKASSSAGNAIDITYSFVDPVSLKNSGHVYVITNNLTSGRSQAFTYDQVNRIISAGTTATTGSTCWGYQFSYDAWGGLAQPNSNTTRDAPPVAVSRVGCCELSLACSSVTAKSSHSCYIVSMPTDLHRYYGSGYSHFITTSCYQRRFLLGTPRSRDLFLEVMEQIRHRHQFVVVGYVVMPEHVHLLFSEHPQNLLSPSASRPTRETATGGASGLS